MIILTLRLFFVKMKIGNAQNLCRINQRKDHPSPIKLPIQHLSEHGHDGVELALVFEE